MWKFPPSSMIFVYAAFPNELKQFKLDNSKNPK
jgi:hypothetical protein